MSVIATFRYVYLRTMERFTELEERERGVQAREKREIERAAKIETC